MKRKTLVLTALLMTSVMMGGCAGSPSSVSHKTISISEESEVSVKTQDTSVSASNSVSTENEKTEPVSTEPAKEEPGPDPDASLKELIASMTLEEKVAQMTMPAFDVWNEEVKECLKDINPGGVILFAKNCQSPEQLKDLTSELKGLADYTSTKIPMLIAIDQEGGAVTRIRFTTDYPEAAAVAETGDPQNAYKNGFAIGIELSEYSIDIDFAPVMDVNSNPKNPIIGRRSFSSDADTVAEYGVQMLKGLKDSGIIGCLKHFPGHGDTSTDSHTGLPKVDKTLDDLRALELKPFKAGIDAGAQMIMTAHIEFPNIETEEYHPMYSSDSNEKITLPATLSKTILTDILRGELGFVGVIVTDALEMKAIANFFPLIEATRLSINAGADLMLIPVRITGAERIKQFREYINNIATLVRSGDIDESRIDESVLRILKLKY